MADEKTIKVWIEGLEQPLSVRGKTPSYKFEYEGQYKDHLRVWADHTTLIIPFSKLLALETNL